MVQFESLVATPQHYNGQLICTRGVALSGFEASGLAAATYEDEGAVQLTEPIIWLERADVRSQTDCFTTSTVPVYEFCRATVCGRFEYGSRYGHLGGYEFQLRGQAGTSRSSTAEPPVQSLGPFTSPTLSFRSDQYHLNVTLPPGWAAAEGSERLASPFVGLVAFNSWGQAGFWAPALKEADVSNYWPLSVLVQVPDGGAYVILTYRSGLPYRAGEEYGPEHEREDLLALWGPRDCREAGGATWVSFDKWGRLFRLEVYCHPDAPDATAAAVDALIASWRFDRAFAGDPGWASAQARLLLPRAVHPEDFPVLTGEFGDESPLRASVEDRVAARITEAVIQGETVLVTFKLRRDDLSPAGNGDDCPPNRCHWWRFEARPDGEVALVEEGGAALSLLPIEGTQSRYDDPALGFAVEYPSDWQVTEPTQHFNALERPWMAVEFISPLYAYGHPAYNRYNIRVAMTESAGETLTETANLSLSLLAPGFRNQVSSHCCLTVGGEPALELLGFPPTRWGNRQLVILHEGREYRLDFYPQPGFSAETEAGAVARRAVETFLRTFTFIPITENPFPLTPTVAPIPTPTSP